MVMSREGKGLQSLRDAFAGCLDKSFAQCPEPKEERDPLCIRPDRHEATKHFVCKLHTGDLHQIGEFTHRFDIDPDTGTAYGDGHQFSGVADAEVESFCDRSVAPRIKPGFSTLIAEKGYILRSAIETFA